MNPLRELVSLEEKHFLKEKKLLLIGAQLLNQFRLLSSDHNNNNDLSILSSLIWQALTYLLIKVSIKFYVEVQKRDLEKS